MVPSRFQLLGQFQKFFFIASKLYLTIKNLSMGTDVNGDGEIDNKKIKMKTKFDIKKQNQYDII